MKFAKVLKTNADQMPEEWRPYLIHYKALKKRINAIVEELEDRGLPSPIIKTLLHQSIDGHVQRLEYEFNEDEGDQQHLKTCLRVVLNGDLASYGPLPPEQEEQLSQLLAANEAAFLQSASSSTSDLHEQLLLDSVENSEVSSLASIDTTPPLSPSRTDGGGDDSSTASTSPSASICASPTLLPITVSTPLRSSPLSGPPPRFIELDDDSDASSAGDDLGHRLATEHQQQAFLQGTAAVTHGQSSLLHSVDSSASIASSGAYFSEDQMDVADTKPHQHPYQHHQNRHIHDHHHEQHNQLRRKGSRVVTTEEDGKRVLVIQLTADTAFFDQLGEEVSQLSKLQEANKKEFEGKVENLSKVLTVVSSPSNKDMYTWREILKIYLDAQVFVGDSEQDRTTRSSEKAQTQLQWFLREVQRNKLVSKFKQSKSKAAFNTFFDLNSDLITMKQFKELNQMAMTKILKKHDKRTSLTASAGFPKHLQNEPFYNDNLSKALTYTIGCQLVSIIPQPDDYLCPICMAVAWKPIRLNCNHVFCVRCLIKAQRKKMINCPICRHDNSVAIADASNLDVSLMNFMSKYFPKEIKEKRKEASREQAAEDLQIMTQGRHAEDACTIM
ncbi:hypothetical protein BGZ73_008024 [Actinomortierella ambigua]|nr:hypothetical protein BGZ73_008024 [Actinomortierella ambigua]